MSTQTTASPATAKRSTRRSALEQNDRIDSILLRLESIRSQKGSFVIGVCGCNRRSGASTIAANLAVRAAEMDLGQVLLMDGNFKNPKQAANFRLGNCDGLADVLAGHAEPENAVQNGAVDGLSVISAGKRKSIKSLVLTPDAVNALMNEIRTAFDYVIIDLPGDAESARSVMLSGYVDGAVVILDAQTTRARNAKDLVATLRENNVDILGAVLNKTRRILPSWLDRLL